jgi:hypothetical protein
VGAQFVFGEDDVHELLDALEDEGELDDETDESDEDE